MKISEVTSKEYSTFAVNPFSKFDTAEFNELNSHKIESLKFFIFENSKKRFALAAGIKDKILKSPFSASFSCFSEISKNNKIEHYHDAVLALKFWCKDNGLKKIILCTPALIYNKSHITKFHNALICNGFEIMDYDVNFEYNLKNYSNNYIDLLTSNSRRNLNIAIKNKLIFEKTNDVETVYSIIKQNRQEKNFPLRMSLDDIKNTSHIIKSDYFLIYDINNIPIAGTYVQRITDNTVNIVYWGNLQKYDGLCPMNFMGYKIFEYYSQDKKLNYISIGISTENSIPNFGLCNFKESIGCSCSPKLNFKLDKI